VVRDLKEGDGIAARPGDVLVTKFVAYFVGGRKLESSWNPGSEAFTFRLGAEEANPGWEKGIPGMRVGGRRLLIVPPDEGSRFGPVREGKPKDTLVYVVELVAIIPPELRSRQEPHIAAPPGPPPNRLVVRRLIKATGPLARKGDRLTVEYATIHYDGTRSSSNSWKRKKPFSFKLGSGSILVNAGWEEGLQGMRVGERRELIVPPKLLHPGHGESRSSIGEPLVYVIDLMGIAESH